MKTLILLLVTLPSLGDTKGSKNGDSANSIYLRGAYPITAKGTTDEEEGGVNVTKERGKPQHGGILGSGSVWHRWKPVFEGRFEISVNSENLDIILAVYPGESLDSLPPENRYKDLILPTMSLKAREPFTSGARVEFEADPNTLYSIAIDGDRLTSGDFTIKMSKSKNPLDSIEVVLPADSNKMNEIKN
jgi:hypothetical protein